MGIEWTPEKYIAFLHIGNSPEQRRELDRKLLEAARKYKEAIETHGLSLAKIGNGLIKLLVARLNCFDFSSEEGRKLMVRETEGINHQYNQILGKELWPQIMHGALAEFGTALALSEHVGYPVYYPSTEEDLKGKIDWWVDLENGKTLAVQVKTLPLTEDPEEKIISISSEADIENLTKKYGYAISDLAFFEENARAMINFCQQWDNVQPVFILLPPVESEYSRIHSLTGLPTDREGRVDLKEKSLGRELFEEIETKFLPKEV